MKQHAFRFFALALLACQLLLAPVVAQKTQTAPKPKAIDLLQPPGLDLATLKEIVAGADFVNPTLHGEALKAAATVAFGYMWSGIGAVIGKTELCQEANTALKDGKPRFSLTVNVKNFGGDTHYSYGQSYMAFQADGGVWYVPIAALKDGQVIYGKPEKCARAWGLENKPLWNSALQETKFDTQYGKTSVRLPNDIRAGDTISGTVSVEPAGGSDAVKVSSNATLQGMVIEIDGKQTRVSSGKLLLTIGAEGGLVPIILRDPNGAIIAISGTNAVPPNMPVTTPRPVGAVSPAGQPLSIPGNFDGNAANTNVTINNMPVELIAESPRVSIVNCPPGTTGPVEIMVSDPKSTVTARTNVVGIELSAPKLNLIKGERTSVTVEVIGLQGLKEPLPVKLTASSGVRLQGGNNQTIMVDPVKADTNGVVRRTFSLQSKVPGGFDVTGDLLPPKGLN